MDAFSQKLDELITEVRLIREQAEPVREIMSIPKAAQYLDQSEHTLRKWVKERKVPHSKINGTLKFRKSRLDAWVKRNEVRIFE